jgi:hypothetical protein
LGARHDFSPPLKALPGPIARPKNASKPKAGTVSPQKSSSLDDCLLRIHSEYSSFVNSAGLGEISTTSRKHRIRLLIFLGA